MRKGATIGQALEALERAKAGGETPVDDLTLAEFSVRYLDEATPNVTAGPRRNLVALIKNHILPYFRSHPSGSPGTARMADINGDRVKRYKTALEKDGISANIMQKATIRLKAVLNYATECRVVRDNAGLAIKAARYRAPESKPYDTRTERLVLEAAQGDPYEALYWMGLMLGMRAGEILGVQEADVDEAFMFHLTRAIKGGDKGQAIVGAPKYNSTRRLQFPAPLIAKWESTRALKPARSRWAFPREDGSFMSYGHFMRAHWWKLLDRAGIGCLDCGHLRREHANARRGQPRHCVAGCACPKYSGLKFHGLRHTYATNALRDHVDIKVLSYILGHKDPAMTLRIYQHFLPDMQGAATAASAARYRHLGGPEAYAVP